MERLVSIDDAAYPLGDGIYLTTPKRKPIITRVTDDRRDPENAKYYRIYHRGLDEDARAYVDRTHEWNGMTKEGMPYFLRGADYVATFNDDKKDSPTITIELSQPTMLYVFIDDRMAIPIWLKDNFENTGRKIGLDEGPSRMETYSVGIGPGVSVETVHSVWQRAVLISGPVCIGPVEKSPGGARSMYGIAAQPIE